MTELPLRRICVFCGSSPGGSAAYAAAAEDLGRALAEAGIAVVAGGAGVGLMGRLADSALAAGGEVIGVIPRALVAAEVAHHGLADLRIVASMHERKALMAELADGFVALPGGLGTLEEFTEVVTWSQLGLHAKPTALLNTAGYYDALLQFLDHAVAESFLRPDDRGLILAAGAVRPMLDQMTSWRAREGQRWVPADEPEQRP